MSDRMIFTCTYGPDEPERATLPFVGANIAATAGRNAAVMCTIDGVWLGVAGRAEEVAAPGLPRLCGACTKPREIGEGVLRPGARIVGAAMVIEEVALGAKTVSLS
jgi:predicted peroxiredoxin